MTPGIEFCRGEDSYAGTIKMHMNFVTLTVRL
jgi:hypothetical protein